jgi:hypothetical protein
LSTKKKYEKGCNVKKKKEKGIHRDNLYHFSSTLLFRFQAYSPLTDLAILYFHPQLLPETADHKLGVRVGKVHHQALSAGPSAPTGPVYVVLCVRWEFVVHYVGKFRDVQTAGGELGSDYESQASVSQTRNDFLQGSQIHDLTGTH